MYKITPPSISNGNIQAKRNSSVELLRIFAILMIISMHLMGKWWTTSSIINRELILFFNSFFNTGSSLFILISGYYRLNFKIEKALHLWFQTLTYTIPLLFLSWFLLDITIGGKFILHSFFPILTNYKWFITSYLILYILSPFINLFVEQLSVRQLRSLILVGCIFFILSPTVLLISIQNDAGKGIVNMFLVYIIGRYIRLYGVPSCIVKNRKSIACLCILLTFIGNSILTNLKGQISVYYAYDCSLFILCLSIIFFSIFIDLELDSPFINSLAKYCFPIYLFSDFVWLLLMPYIEYFQNSYFCWLIMPCFLVLAILMTVLYEKIRQLLFDKIEKNILKVLKFKYDNYFKN